MSGQLYESKKFTSWNIGRVTEALCAEWSALEPELGKGVVVYGKKANQIVFKGEVNVTLGLMRDTYPSKDVVQITTSLSLSPQPDDLAMHVLNTLDLGLILGCFPELTGKSLFSIKKDEPWEGSFIQTVAQYTKPVIASMLQFETCFHLLLDDEYQIDGKKLDMKSLGMSHHLNQVKAYRLAEAYGHPEKLDEAAGAIKRFAKTHEQSRQRIEALCAKNPQDAANWLYTADMIKRLCE